MDQLARESGLAAAELASLAALLDRAQAQLDAGRKDEGLADSLRTQARSLGGGSPGTRKARLARVLDGIAAKLG
jgi:hypothetical protein